MAANNPVITPVTFLNQPGLVPLHDGVNWRLDGALQVRLPDGRIIEIPDGFETDLASIPPLGVVGGCVMWIGWLLGKFYPITGDVLVFIGFLICLASAYLKAYGKYTYSAVFHDWMFRTHAFPFTVCNWFFLLAMRGENTVRWERFLIWFNVQAFGLGIYNNEHRRRRPTPAEAPRCYGGHHYLSSKD